MRGSAVAAVLLVASAVLVGALLPTTTAASNDISIDYDGEAVTVAAGESQVISGETTLPPGTSVSVRVKSDSDVTPGFFQTKTVAVDQSGTWAAAFDFSEQSPGDTFQVEVTAEDTETTADGEVTACSSNCEESTPEPVETVQIDQTNGTVNVSDARSQVISGSALAPAGTEVSLRLRSTDSGVQFFKVRNAVVTENGTWAAAFDFSKQAAGDEFSIEATVDGESAEAKGVVESCDADCQDQPPTGTPTPFPDTEQETVTPGNEVALFEQKTIRTQQSGTVEFSVSLDGTDKVGLTLGEYEKSGYSLDVTLRDVNGDGRVTVRFDTAAAGQDGQTVTAVGEDSLTVNSETELDAPLAAGEYTLFTYPPSGGADAPTDLAAFVVSEGGTETEKRSGTATASVTGAAESVSEVGDTPVGIAVSGVLVLGGAGLALLLTRG